MCCVTREKYAFEISLDISVADGAKERVSERAITKILLLF